MPNQTQNGNWLRFLADQIDNGREINPCPKDLRRIANDYDRWVPTLEVSSASTAAQSMQKS